MSASLSLPVPRLSIPAGTQFGFRSGPVWRRRPRCLVEADEAIVTEPGLHLLVAPNGAGKTTLLRTLAGLSPALAGGVVREGCVHYFSDELRMDAELKPRALFRAWFGGESRQLAAELADRLKLPMDCPIGRLSRGNRQKVLLILAEVKIKHAGGPALLLMDEPLSGLDAETRVLVTDLWAAASTQAVRWVILHELESVRTADSLLTIRAGRLKHATTRLGGTWLETYQALQS